MKILSAAVLAVSSMPFSHAFMPQAAFRPTETQMNLFAMDSPPAIEITQGKRDGALWFCYRFLLFFFLTFSISFLYLLRSVSDAAGSVYKQECNIGK
jgi:hypothetical protein